MKDNGVSIFDFDASLELAQILNNDSKNLTKENKKLIKYFNNNRKKNIIKISITPNLNKIENIKTK